MLRLSAEPNHARRHSKRASFPGGKTARFPLPALDEGDRTRAGRLLRQAGLPDQGNVWRQLTETPGTSSGAAGFDTERRSDPALSIYQVERNCSRNLVTCSVELSTGGSWTETMRQK